MANQGRDSKAPSRALGGPAWVLDEAANALSSSNLAKVGGALARADSVVFGWHYHFAGGSGRSDLIFTSYADCVRYFEAARAGDHLTLYDLDEVAPHAEVHIGTPESDDRLAASPNWRPLREYMSNDEDAVVIVRASDIHSGSVEAAMHLPTYPLEDWLPEFERETASRRGELLAFGLRTLDRASHGVIESVTPPRGDRRLLALLDAKRPADDGTVPSSGPY